MLLFEAIGGNGKSMLTWEWTIWHATQGRAGAHAWAKRITLPGLRPSDAERLLRSCGIEGDSAAIQSYLTTNCDNHPLVIGILGGLINKPGPARGSLDAWAAHSEGGAKLDLASLDLIQRRNHILRAALDALLPASRQLLSTLALLSESVDYETLCAFDPHVPPDTKKLAATVTDLEQRGLLQYDGRTRRHDLHPVVRGVAAGGMQAEDKERYGQRVVDHFSSLPHNPYEQAETLEDLRPGLNVVGTLLKLGHFQQAADAYLGDLANALLFNIEAHTENLSLLRPFFPAGWGERPKCFTDSSSARLANEAAIALLYCHELTEALGAFVANLRFELKRKNWGQTDALLCNISETLVEENLLAKSRRVVTLFHDLAAVRGHREDLFTSRLNLFSDRSRLGQWADAEATWHLLDPMGRGWSRRAYRPGNSEWCYSQFQHWKGTLQESHLATAERLAAEGKNRTGIRDLHRLRGGWLLEQREWALAAASFAEAVRMARESGIPDAESETGLALVKHHLGQLAEPQREAERLAELRKPAHRLLAQRWLALGDPAEAKPHALAAYRWAWADGEPYVHRYELTKTTELLQQMNVEIPKLPPYDPAKDEPFPWEADVRAAIEKLRAEKEAEEKSD